VAPSLEINMYPFHRVFSMPQFMNTCFLCLSFYCWSRGTVKGKKCIYCIFSVRVGFVKPVILFEKSQRIYKKIQNIAMHKPWGCVIALNFTVACEAVWEE